MNTLIAVIQTKPDVGDRNSRDNKYVCGNTAQMNNPNNITKLWNLSPRANCSKLNAIKHNNIEPTDRKNMHRSHT